MEFMDMHRQMSKALGAHRPAAWFWLLPVMIASACGDGGSQLNEPQVVRRDSASLTIIETVRPEWDNATRWSLEPEPSLVIGKLDGDMPYLFGDLRGAIRLDNGTIVALDNQARELRWFSPSGEFLRSVGRPGGGPGEFSHSAYKLERCGADRIYVHDLWGLRIHVWDTAGVFQRSFALLEPATGTSGPYHHTCRDDGGFVVVGWGDRRVPPLPPNREALTYRQDASVWALDSAGNLQHELGTFLSSERVRVSGGSGPHPFGRAIRLAAGNGSVFMGTGEAMAVHVYNIERMNANSPAASDSTRPEPSAIWRARVDDLSFDDEARQSYASAELDERDGQMRDWILNGEVDMPSALPAYVDLQVARDGSLWVKRFRAPWEAIERWGVFAEDGVFRGDIVFPERFQVTDIGEDYVLGIASDSLDVQRIHLYSVRK